MKQLKDKACSTISSNDLESLVGKIVKIKTLHRELVSEIKIVDLGEKKGFIGEFVGDENTLKRLYMLHDCYGIYRVGSYEDSNLPALGVDLRPHTNGNKWLFEGISNN